MTETARQRQERIGRHLAEARACIEDDIAGTEDFFMKLIEADAAAVATLSIIKELLPNQVREEVQAIIELHEQVWSMDGSSVPGVTPRKPLRERLLSRIAIFMRIGEDRVIQARRFSSFSRQ